MQTLKYSHILALSNEEGFVSLFDTSRKFALPTCYERNAGLFWFNFEFNQFHVNCMYM